MSPTITGMESASVAFTVGKIEEGIAILVSDDLQLVEFPTTYLPSKIGPIGVGSVISLHVGSSSHTQNNRLEDFIRLQGDLLEKYGKKPDAKIILRCLKSIMASHSSLIAGWQSWDQMCLEHGWKVKLHSLDCLINGSVHMSGISGDESELRMAGLESGKIFEVQLVFRTSDGTFRSEAIEMRTKDETDFSGLHLLLPQADEETLQLAGTLGANVTSQISSPLERISHILVDSISECPADVLLRAKELGIPVLQKGWLKSCQFASKLESLNNHLLQ